MLYNNQKMNKMNSYTFRYWLNNEGFYEKEIVIKSIEGKEINKLHTPKIEYIRFSIKYIDYI